MVEVIAHRGFSGKYPENTLLSVKKALELGVDSVEVDVWLSMDNRVVVMHDMTLDRTTNCKGRILWKGLKELKKCRTKERNQPISFLEELFPLANKDPEAYLNIEIKSMWTARPVAELIKKYDMQDRVLVSSVSTNALRMIRHELPSVRIAYIFFNSYSMQFDLLVTALARMNFRLTQWLVIRNAKALKANHVNLSYPFVSKGFIRRLHKQGFKVNVWVVNTPALMKKMIRYGVDGIITDHPDKLKKLLAKASPEQRKIRLPSLKGLNHNIKLSMIRH
ncbi:hypothetical protein JXB28_00480 [Candidatus Woesearchaeota archaeon]|nr:hypothetical protein [Candidatus Woesearchaeota archaeon]